MKHNGEINKMDNHANQSGAALITSMLILLVMTIIAIASMGSSTLEEKISSNYKAHKQAFFHAEEGLLEAIKKLSLYDKGATPTPSTPAPVTTKTNTGIIVYSFKVENKPDATTPTPQSGTVTWDDTATAGTYAFNLKNTPYSNLENYVYKITSTGISGDSRYEVKAEVSRPVYFRIPATFYGISEVRAEDRTTIQGRDVCAQPNWPTLPPTLPIGLPSVAINGLASQLAIPNPGKSTVEGVKLVSGTPTVLIDNNSVLPGYNLNVTPYINQLSSATSAKIFNLSGANPKANNMNFDKPYNTTTSLPPTGSGKKPGDCDDSNTVDTSSPGTLSSTSTKDGATNNIIVINIQAGAKLELKNFSGCGTLIVKSPPSPPGTPYNPGELEISGNSQWNGLILTTAKVHFEDYTTILGSVISSYDLNKALSPASNAFEDYTNISYCQAALDPILTKYLPPMEIISWQGNDL